jgi:hypothetical protein
MYISIVGIRSMHECSEEFGQQCGLLLQIECRGYIIDIGSLDNDILGFPGICRALDHGEYLLGALRTSAPWRVAAANGLHRSEGEADTGRQWKGEGNGGTGWTTGNVDMGSRAGRLGRCHRR